MFHCSDKRQGTLAVDDERPVVAVSDDGATQLDTDGALWLGGIEGAIPGGLPYSGAGGGFQGCVASASVDGEPLDLAHHRLTPGELQYCDADADEL
jgi:agrin